MSSLKTNVVLNFVNTLTGIIFPVITFPYAARVLQPQGIGAVNFLNSIVAYLVLLTSLGIPMYAVREVAKHRDDIALRNRTTIEILVLSLLLSLAGYVAVWVLGWAVPRINSQLSLFYVLSLTVVFTALGANWFYQAVEDFKFVTIRALIFRTLAAIALFVFVKRPSDLLIYAFVIVGSTVGNNVFNFVHLRRYIPLAQIPWRRLRIGRHIKPALHVFVLNLIISIYIQLNTVMLGFMKDDAAVGLFTAGNRLQQIVLTAVASMGVVLLPRCSHLIETGAREEFARVCTQSLRFAVMLALPCAAGLMLLARPIIIVFCGAEYVAADVVVAWTAPVILFISLTNVYGIQVLYPQGRENIVIISTIGGAVANVVLNLLLVPAYSYAGAAVATCIAELVVLVLQVVVGRRYIPLQIFDRRYLTYAAATLIMSAAVAAAAGCTSTPVAQLLAGTAAGMATYAAVLLLVKDELLMEMWSYALSLLHRRKA